MVEVLKKQSVQDKVEKGILGLKYTGGTSYGNIYEDKRADFTFPKSIETFQYMAQDSTIAASNNIIDVMIGKVDWGFQVPDNATGKQKKAAEFLNFCMNHMEGTWKSFIEEVGSYRVYGFHIAEKVWREITPEESRKFSGKMTWKKLPTRSQSTIAGWKFDDRVRELKSVKQDINGLTNIYRIRTDETGLIDLPVKDILLFSYKKRRGNPEGESPLKSCFQPWTYKKTAENYEAIMLAKDLGGIPVIGIDANYLAKAQEDPNSPEAAVLETLQTNAENLHAGDSTYYIKPISYTDSGKELFTFELKGIEGSGGKNYSTRDIINGKQLEILMIYLADVLKLGSESTGSYALAENKNNLLAFGVQNHLQFIVDVIQEQLVPQTLKVNGFDLKREEYPVLTYSDLDEEDIDQLGKLVQRLASTNMIPRTKETVNEILERSGFKYRLQDGDVEKDNLFTANTVHPEIFSDNESGASEGMESGLPSGTGDSLGNNSSVNLDNKA